jgi:predicted DNA-binding transcriptional regulator YafY
MSSISSNHQQVSPPQITLEQALRATPPANDPPIDRLRLRLTVRAIHEQRVCLIRYASEPGGAICLRAIEPLTISSSRGALAVLAWCRLRGDLRTFRLDRIRNIALTTERFDVHPALAFERFIQGRRRDLRKQEPRPLR